jgi:hypothetical protein
MGEFVKQDRTHNRMQRFTEIYGPTQHVSVRETDGRQWLDVNDPAILASFVAFCKARLHSNSLRVYLRGQSSRHATLVPSLFRKVDLAQLQRRWAAYRRLLGELPRIVKGTRFTKKNFGAVLQHYGFRTPWLDVVDDLHVAIWFAINNFSEKDGEFEYRPSTADQGWVVVVAVPRAHRVVDLRTRHSSRHVRCHAQQAFSIAMQSDDKPKPAVEQDFIHRVVGTVRIPNEPRWLLSGYRASQGYFFPPPNLDDTYRKLLDSQVAALAESAEREYDLRLGTLGRVARYRRTD